MEKQNILIPSIPDLAMSSEDIRQKRISLSPSIFGCVQGKCEIEKLKYDNRIRVYTVDVPMEDQHLKDWRYLYNNNLVQDAVLTQEHWYTLPLVPCDYSEYEVINPHASRVRIVESHYKEKIILALEENWQLGKDLKGIKDLNAFEILNYWLPQKEPQIQKIVIESLSFEIEDFTEESAQNYEIIFGEKPPKTHIGHNFTEFSYIDSCDLRRI